MIKHTFLAELRKDQGISQAFTAKKIGVSRASYIEIEKGAKELTVSQAKKIAGLFGISLDELLAGKKMPSVNIKVSLQEKPERGLKLKAKEESKEGKESKKGKLEIQEIRIDVPKKNLKKFKEILLYILEKTGGKPNVGMTVLYKLLYFIDFDYYEKFEEQLIGATYIRNHFGPTPVEFKKIVESMEENGELETVKSQYFRHEQTKYLPHRDPDISVLSAKEIKHIDEVLSRLSDKSATELSDYSHKDVPWITAEEGRPIPYESVFYRTKDTSVREYEPDHV